MKKNKMEQVWGDDRAEMIYNVGKWLGYPDCCCSYFISKDEGPTEEQTLAGQIDGEATGFMPCPECAKKILNKEIKITDLIKDRQHSAKFPDENKEEFRYYVEPIMNEPDDFFDSYCYIDSVKIITKNQELKENSHTEYLKLSSSQLKALIDGKTLDLSMNDGECNLLLTATKSRKKNKILGQTKYTFTQDFAGRK